jgi:hypothetical protein
MNDRKTREVRRTATARSLKLERVQCNGMQHIAFRDSSGALRDYSTGAYLQNAVGIAPLAVSYFF